MKDSHDDRYGKSGKDRQKKFSDEITDIEIRRIHERENSDKEYWFGLGMMGIIGWSVAVPSIGGLALGVWLDTATGSEMSWALTGLAAGVCIGCVTAWYWIKHESEDE